MELCDLHLYAWRILLKLLGLIFQRIRVTGCHVYFAESNRLHPGAECEVYVPYLSLKHASELVAGLCPNSVQGTLCH